MKTQISRNTFAAEKRFSGIYQQMGRMMPDADWNELSELVKERLNDTLRDVVGSGTPRGRGLVRRLPGPPPDRCELRWGHAYVDGVPAQVRPAPGAVLADPAGALFEYALQADFPDPPGTISCTSTSGSAPSPPSRTAACAIPACTAPTPARAPSPWPR